MATSFVLTPAYILHYRPYRDTSLLIDFFTEEQGRISVLARGVRKPKSRLSGLLQPFIPLLISWAGKGELFNLRAVEANGLGFSLLNKNLLSGFYSNELLVRVLPRYDAHPQLFQAYAQLLCELQSQNSCEKSLRLFEKTLLEELGYGLQLQYEAHSDTPIQAESYYCYSPDQGFSEANVNNVESGKLLFQGQHLLNLQHDLLDDAATLRSAKHLMRVALQPLLGNKPLLTRKMFVS
ncbi:DNA repair protein RecO [soil metagenome]